MHFYTRLCYNTSDWQHPTGHGQTEEAPGVFPNKFNFGFEEWLFRKDFEHPKGSRYRFLQGVNQGSSKHRGECHDVTLFVIEGQRRRLVATIKNVYFLRDDEWDDAMNTFAQRGWNTIMENEITAVGGEPAALYNKDYTQTHLNIRYNPVDVHLYQPKTYLNNNPWVMRRWRYSLYRLNNNEAGLPIAP